MRRPQRASRTSNGHRQQAAVAAISLAILATGCNGDSYSDEERQAWCERFVELANTYATEVDDSDGIDDTDLGALVGPAAGLLEVETPPELRDVFEMAAAGPPDVFDYETGEQYEAAAARYMAAQVELNDFLVEECGMDRTFVESTANP